MAATSSSGRPARRATSRRLAAHAAFGLLARHPWRARRRRLPGRLPSASSPLVEFRAWSPPVTRDPPVFLADVEVWLGRKDSNLRSPDPETCTGPGDPSRVRFRSSCSVGLCSGPRLLRCLERSGHQSSARSGSHIASTEVGPHLRDMTQHQSRSWPDWGSHLAIQSAAEEGRGSRPIAMWHRTPQLVLRTGP